MMRSVADPTDFHSSLAADAPPPGLSVPLQALWWSGKGRWERAHELAQSVEGRDGAWVHAHLHRVEGDLANAAYWYRRASRDVCTTTIEAEWRALTAAMLQSEAGADG